MGSITFTDELNSSVPAEKLFKGLILDGDNLIPKLLPQAIKSIETIEGDGGPGSIKKTTLIEGKYLKHRIDALDKENMKYSYTLIEGDELMEKIESISYEIMFEASPNGGCKVTNVSKFVTKPGMEMMTEDELIAGKLKAKAVYDAVQDHLLLNPEAYA